MIQWWWLILAFVGGFAVGRIWGMVEAMLGALHGSNR
jgi:ABC-type uncharacterized transport system permease subunit